MWHNSTSLNGTVLNGTCHIIVQSQNNTCHQTYISQNKNRHKTYCLQSGTTQKTLFCQSRFVFPVLPVPCCLSWSAELDRQNGPAYPVLPFLTTCPVLPVQLWTSYSACFACPVLSVQFCLSCSASPMLTILFLKSCLPVKLWTSSSACPVMSVLFCVSYSACSFQPVLFFLACYACPVLAFLSFPVLGTNSLVRYFCYRQ